MTIQQDESIRVFETSAAPPKRVKFILRTTHNLTGEKTDHAFDVPGRMSAGAQLWLAQFAPDEHGKSIADAGIIMGFFQRVMSRDDFLRFARVVDDPEVSVELQYLGALLDFVVEEITGRRPTRPGDSSQSPPSAGPSWTAPPSPAGAISPPFRPDGS